MIGTVLDGRYRLEQELASDPRVTEYAGVDLRLHRPVRVKVVNPDSARDERYMESWRQAAGQIAALAHPNIVPVCDVCLAGDTPYLVEAAVDAQPLADLLERGAHFSGEQIAVIARQAARALAAAHQMGVVHGGLAPACILVDSDDAVYVADFGRPMGDTTDLSRARYLAPEQSLGRAPDPAADVYALASTIYHLATGHPPFDGPSAVAIGTRKNTTDPPPLPPGHDLPAGLAGAVEAALARNPAGRPADGARFGDAIEGGPRTVPPPEPTATVVMPSSAAPTPPSRRSPTHERGPGGVLLALIILAGIGAALIYAFKHPGGDIPVPNLIGRTEQEAQKLLADLQLRADIVDRIHNDDVPGGRVISQEPPADSKVLADSGVSLVISKGPRYVTVPSLIGTTEAEAKVALAKSGLAYGGSETSHQSGVADGVVTAQEPAAGRKVDKGTAVRLFVNAEPDEPEPAENAPDQAEETGLVDEALEQFKERAGAAVGELAEGIKERAGEAASEFAEELKERTREELREKGQELRDKVRDEVRRRLGRDDGDREDAATDP